MDIQYRDFIHPADKKALDTLKAIPGVDLVLKKLMNLVAEKMFQIEATSSFLKLGPSQMPEMYNVLVKVCKKLEIDPIPELYLQLDREPNAYTLGDTDVFIVLHSGLLETMTLEEIETVIAHECGHIVCRHVLYHTIGRYLLDGASWGASLIQNGLVAQAIIVSLQYAFAYWMRCSEFSADRVAAFYHGSAEPVVACMMAFAGATKNLQYQVNREDFFKQALNYKALIDNSTYNKTLEFIKFGQIDHPLNAYRAYEINEFYKKYSTKLLLQNGGLLGGKEEEINEYNLRIRYEFIKSKFMLKIRKSFNNNQLAVEVQQKKYVIEKNDTKDIRVKGGCVQLLIKNSTREMEYIINLQYNMDIVVRWDCDSETLTVEEEL